MSSTQGHALVLLHGLFLRPFWMRALARDFRRAGFAPIWNLGYGRGPDLTTISADLTTQLQQLRTTHSGPIHGLGLSMGGLILRRLHADGALGDHPDSHYLTLGTPHQGAYRAEWGTDLYPRLSRWIYGPTLFELRPDSPFLAELPHLPGERTLSLYSGTGTEAGRKPYLPGDDDGIVETRSAHLPHAHNQLIPGVHHHWLGHHPRIRSAAVEWLRARAGLDAGLE